MATAPRHEDTGKSPPPLPADSDRFPPGIPYIVGNEGAERFSFYGMKAILKIHLIALFLKYVNENAVSPEQLADAKVKSTEVVHLFVAGVYAFPLIGAILADRFLGKYLVIFWVSLIYCLGHAVLAVSGRFGGMEMWQAAEWSMYLGLFLIAIGSGGIKPCVSANVGDQFTSGGERMVTKVFQIFYFIINYGSFFSTILTPLLLRWFGPEVAFGVPGVLMGIATYVFWLGRNKFVHVPPKPGGKLGLFDTLVTTLLFSPLFALILGYFVLWGPFNEEALKAAEAAGIEASTMAILGGYFLHYWWLPAGTVGAVALGFYLFGARQRIQADTTSFLPVLLWSFRNQSRRAPGQGFFDPARAAFGEEAGEGPPAVLKVMLVFSMVSVFWALFDQHASTWVDQAKQMALGLYIPAWFGYWAFAATILLSLYAGIWLFTWIGNNPLPRRATSSFIGVVLALGVIAAALDFVGPAIGNRVVTVVINVDSKDAVEKVTRAISTLDENTPDDGKPVEIPPASVVVVDASDRPLVEGDFRRAVASRAFIATLNVTPPPDTLAMAQKQGVEIAPFSGTDDFLAEIQRRREVISAQPRPRKLSVQMDAAQLSALNPLMVMIIIPALNLLLYAPLRRRKIEVKPLQKMTVGMFLAAAAFASAAVLQLAIEKWGDGVVHGLWQAIPYFIMTTAEVLVSITGLEFAYTQAPRAMKSTMMGFWLLCVTFGNLIVAFLAPLQGMYKLSVFFWVFAGLMTFAAVVFLILAYLYKGKTYLQHAPAK